MVAKYLREQGFWMADRRLREGRHDDQGDLDGVPFTTVQVKYVERPSVPVWMTETLKQRDTAGTPLCLLVVRKKQKRPEAWDAYMPSSYFVASFEDTYGHPVGDHLDEAEAWTWMRMDLRLAARILRRIVAQLSPSGLSLSTTPVSPYEGDHGAQPSVPSTEKPEPASHSTWTLGSSSASSATPKAPPST